MILDAGPKREIIGRDGLDEVLYLMVVAIEGHRLRPELHVPVKTRSHGKQSHLPSPASWTAVAPSLEPSAVAQGGRSRPCPGFTENEPTRPSTARVASASWWRATRPHPSSVASRRGVGNTTVPWSGSGLGGAGRISRCGWIPAEDTSPRRGSRSGASSLT